MQEQRVKIAVEGMTCGGCVKAVTNAIRSVPGVREANVDLEGKAATVAGSGFEAEQVVEAVVGAGFGARVKGE